MRFINKYPLDITCIQIITFAVRSISGSKAFFLFRFSISWSLMYWGQDYLAQALGIITCRLNISCCSQACLFRTDWYSSASRIFNKALYVHRYGHNIHGTFYTELTKTSPTFYGGNCCCSLCTNFQTFVRPLFRYWQMQPKWWICKPLFRYPCFWSKFPQRHP